MDNEIDLQIEEEIAMHQENDFEDVEPNLDPQTEDKPEVIRGSQSGASSRKRKVLSDENSSENVAKSKKSKRKHISVDDDSDDGKESKKRKGRKEHKGSKERKGGKEGKYPFSRVQDIKAPVNDSADVATLAAQLISKFEKWERFWADCEEKKLSCGQLLDAVMGTLEIPSAAWGFDLDAAKTQLRKEVQSIVSKWGAFEYAARKIDKKDGLCTRLLSTKHKIFTVLKKVENLFDEFNGLNNATADFRAKRILTEDAFLPEEQLGWSKLVTLVDKILDDIEACGLRHKNGYVYQERIIDGNRTNTWKRGSQLKTWLLEKRYPEETERVMWGKIYTCGVDAVVGMLNNNHARFPELAWDNSLTGWKNGWFVNMKTKPDFQKRSRSDDTASKDYSQDLLESLRFIPYSKREDLIAISPDFETRAAIKFFDTDFPAELLEQMGTFTEVDATGKQRTYKNFMNIQTPVDDYFKAQKYEVDDLKLIFGMMGRMMHPLRKFDAYTLLLVFLGLAGTGKSALIELLQHMYAESQRFILSNSMEKSFGLMQAIDKTDSSTDLEYALIRAWFAPDLREGWTMDEGQLLSMVAGEWMKINEKYGKGDQAPWKIPGVMACNVLPDILRCKKGSWCDRLFLVEFWNPIKDPPAGHLQSCYKHYGAFYLKCAAAYRWFCELSYDRQIWKKVTPRFNMARKKLLCHNNPFQSFLQDDNFVVQIEEEKDEKKRVILENNVIPLSELIFQFNNYRMERSAKRRTELTDEFLREEILAARKEMARNQEGEWPVGSGKSIVTTWFRGINFRRPLEHETQGIMPQKGLTRAAAKSMPVVPLVPTSSLISPAPIPVSATGAKSLARRIYSAHLNSSPSASSPPPSASSTSSSSLGIRHVNSLPDD